MGFGTDNSGKAPKGPVQHVFHSGWQAQAAEAAQNAADLRDDLAGLGVPSAMQDWTVYSDPREWQVLKNKGLWHKPAPTARIAGHHMAANTLAGLDTVWHGHSQGGAQITQATKLALKEMETSAQVQRKAAKKAAMLGARERREKLGIDRHGNRMNLKKDLLSGAAFEHLDARQQDAELLKIMAHENAVKRLNEHNLFSYCGAAMNPHAEAENARFAHNRGDPVSGWVKDVTPGPRWKKPGDRLKSKMGDPKAIQVDIGKHGYSANYAAIDAGHTAEVLGRNRLLPPGAGALAAQQAPTDPAQLTHAVARGDGKSTGPLLARAGAGLKSAGHGAMAPARWAGGAATWGGGVAADGWRWAKGKVAGEG